MTRSPIPRVLSTFGKRKVDALLMGGQACILYGGAEFSRDVDFCVASDEPNLDRLKAALADLGADPVFFPPLGRDVLDRGHACHFRCSAPEVSALRIDVMSVMRNADGFAKLRSRRHTLSIRGVGRIGVVALQDLVLIKKTQRDKDWPMIRRMVEADIARARRPSASRVSFWLAECRTPELLIALARRHRVTARRTERPAVAAAIDGDLAAVEHALRREEARERALDRKYWRPLRRELEAWRLGRRRSRQVDRGRV